MNQRKNDDRIPTLTRAGFVRSLTMGAAGAAVVLTAGPARAACPAASTTLPDLAIAVLTLIGNKPDLPGAAAVVAFTTATYPTGLSPDDAALLRGALYLACDRLVRGVDALGIDAANGVLSSPVPAIPLASTYFTSLLRQTKARAANDPQFAASVRAAAQLADRVTADPDVPPPADFLFGLIFGVILLVLVIVVLLE